MSIIGDIIAAAYRRGGAASSNNAAENAPARYLFHACGAIAILESMPSLHWLDPSWPATVRCIGLNVPPISPLAVRSD